LYVYFHEGQRSIFFQKRKHYQIEGNVFTVEGAEGGSRSTWSTSDPNSAALSAVAHDNTCCWQGFGGVGMPSCQVLPVGRGPRALGFVHANTPSLQLHAATTRTQAFVHMDF